MTVAESRSLVRGLRAALKEDTATFAERWHCSPRTVEDWEQGRSAPNPFVQDAMRALAKTIKGKATKKKR